MHINLVTTPTDLTACKDLRRDVFVTEQGYSDAEEFDDLDATSTHIIARSGNDCIGTARYFNTGNIGKIGRLCVAKSARKKGLGAELIQFVLTQFAQNPSIDTAYLSAQVQALSFYEGLGFEQRGDTYLDGHVTHVDMFKAL